MQYILPQRTISVPQLIGKNPLDAFEIISKLHLAGTILESKEDSSLIEPHIIQQFPAAGTSIKPTHTVSFIVAFPQKTDSMPIITYPTKSIYADTFSLISIPIITHSQLPTHSIIAQYPEAGNPINALCYAYKTAQETFYLVPNFINQTVYDVEQFLQKYAIQYSFDKRSKHSYPTLQDTAHIIEQYPTQNNVFSLQNPPVFHFTIE